MVIRHFPYLLPSNIISRSLDYARTRFIRRAEHRNCGFVGHACRIHFRRSLTDSTSIPLKLKGKTGQSSRKRFQRISSWIFEVPFQAIVRLGHPVHSFPLLFASHCCVALRFGVAARNPSRQEHSISKQYWRLHLATATEPCCASCGPCESQASQALRHPFEASQVAFLIIIRYSIAD